MDGSEWSVSFSGRFIPKERNSSTHWIGAWMSPNTYLNVVKRKISYHFRESNPESSVVQPVA
jgi:hypothetical protein